MPEAVAPTKSRVGKTDIDGVALAEAVMDVVGDAVLVGDSALVTDPVGELESVPLLVPV